jgi:outer membrane protein assembly factor BamB
MLRLWHRYELVIGTALMATFSTPKLHAEDWTQWQGNQRNGTWSETGIMESFPAEGLTAKWSAEIAGGYAGPSVADNRVFVHDYLVREGNTSPTPAETSKVQGQERIRCYDSDSGRLLWSCDYECPYNISYPAGPRVTPTVDGDRVYALGAEGNLHCLKVADGSIVWRHDLKQKYNIPQSPYWGFCGHPLVHGNKLICLVGGSGSVAVAFDKQTGTEIWRSLSAEQPGYCPPTLIRAGGVEQLIVWHAEEVNSLNPETGKRYWSVPMAPEYGMSIVAPVQYENLLYIGGHQDKSLLLELDRDKPDAKEIWRDRGVGPVHSPVFIEEGYLYGIAQRGQLRCIRLETGEQLWETMAATTGGRPAGSATAFLVKNHDRYFLFNELGDLIIARLSPAGYEETSRVHLLEPTGDGFGRKVLWSHPAFAHRCIYARNDKKLACFSLAAQ